jgi:hypothetical protein
MITDEPNLVHSRTPVQLTINTDSLILKRSVDMQILYSHKMEGISFASAGEQVRFSLRMTSIDDVREYYHFFFFFF